MNAHNGSMRLAYWIMGSLFAILTLFAAGAAHSFEARLSAVEGTQRSRTDTIGTFEGEMRSLREQICRVETKVDDLREDLTKRRVYRRPCP